MFTPIPVPVLDLPTRRLYREALAQLAGLPGSDRYTIGPVIRWLLLAPTAPAWIRAYAVGIERHRSANGLLSPAAALAILDAIPDDVPL